MNYQKVKYIKGPTILLYSGKYFDIENPLDSVFTIEDIAHALSMICRFTGHCDKFYSVAEHSVYTSRIVPPAYMFDALMHDASEAFIGDVSKPLKELLPAYKVIEENIELAISEVFENNNPMPKPVKDADMRMLLTEQRQLMKNTDKWDCVQGYEPADIKIQCFSPAEAEKLFLQRYYELT